MNRLAPLRKRRQAGLAVRFRVIARCRPGGVAVEELLMPVRRAENASRARRSAWSGGRMPRSSTVAMPSHSEWNWWITSSISRSPSSPAWAARVDAGAELFEGGAAGLGNPSVGARAGGQAVERQPVQGGMSQRPGVEAVHPGSDEIGDRVGGDGKGVHELTERVEPVLGEGDE